jgi:transcriptional regulator with XRE-family HTH domain
MTKQKPDEWTRICNQERIKQEAALGIYAIMKAEGIKRRDIADLIGRRKSFISKVLGGSHNFQLETLADIYAALGRAVHFVLGSDLGEIRLPVDESLATNSGEVYQSASAPSDVTKWLPDKTVLARIGGGAEDSNVETSLHNLRAVDG